MSTTIQYFDPHHMRFFKTIIPDGYGFVSSGELRAGDLVFSAIRGGFEPVEQYEDVNALVAVNQYCALLPVLRPIK